MPLIAQAGRPELGPVAARAVAAPGALGSWMEALARAGEGDAVALARAGRAVLAVAAAEPGALDERAARALPALALAWRAAGAPPPALARALADLVRAGTRVAPPALAPADAAFVERFCRV